MLRNKIDLSVRFDYAIDYFKLVIAFHYLIKQPGVELPVCKIRLKDIIIVVYELPVVAGKGTTGSIIVKIADMNKYVIEGSYVVNLQHSPVHSRKVVFIPLVHSGILI